MNQEQRLHGRVVLAAVSVSTRIQARLVAVLSGLIVWKISEQPTTSGWSRGLGLIQAAMEIRIVGRRVTLVVLYQLSVLGIDAPPNQADPAGLVFAAVSPNAT